MNRVSKLKLSVSSSVAAKGLAIILQLITLPIAANNLGAGGLVVYAMLLSINSWLLLSTSGLSPALVIRLSGSNNKKHLLYWATNGYLMFIAIGLVIFILVLSVNHLTDVSSLIFTSEKLLDAKGSIDVIVYIFLLQCICIASDAIILASQKQYLTNMALIFASTISLILLNIADNWIDSPAKLIAIVMIPSLISRMFIGFSFIIYKNLLNISLVSMKYQRLLIKSAIAFFKVGSITNFLLHVLPVLIVGKVYSNEFAAQYTILNTLVILASSVFAIICTPLLPAMRESLKSGDKAWYKDSLKKLKKYCLGLVGVSLVIGWSFASSILNFIFINSVEFDYIYVGLSATYFSTLIWSNYHYILFSAANEVELLSKVFIRKSFFSISVIIFLAAMKVELLPFAIFIVAFFILEYREIKNVIHKIPHV